MGRQMIAVALAVVVMGWGAAAFAQQGAAVATDSGSASGGERLQWCDSTSDSCIPRCCDNCCGGEECGCGSCCCGPSWVVRTDAVFLSRSTPTSAILVTDSFVPGGTVLLNANEFDFDTKAGWDIYLSRERVFGCWGIEVNYFNIDGWNASTSPITSAAGSVIQYVTPIGNTFLPSTISGTYASQLYSVEMNARRQLRDWLTLLLGFRFIELDESGLTILQDIGPGANLAVHSIKSQNSLPGFQIGWDGQIPVGQRLIFQTIGKAGIYGNRASNGVSVTQDLGPSFASAAKASPTAFVGELDFAVLYTVNDHLFVRAGYEFLWLDGVATASDQVTVSDPANGVGGITCTNTVYYHGAFVGLEFRR